MSKEEGAGMEFEVALKMRNFSELQQRINKGEIISPQEMTEKYDPTAADEQAVVDWLRNQGLAISRRDKNHLAIFVRGTVGQIERALQVKFARVSVGGNECTSAVTAPSVPLTIAPLLVGINGLQPHLRARKHSIVSGSAPYLPSQIASAYSANGMYASNVTGAGQTIAVVIDTFPAASDLTSFWQTAGVNQSINNISFVQVVAGTLPTDTSEATLDTEWTSSIAPGAQVRVYATKDLLYSDTDQAYQQIYEDATKYGIHQVSLSYGGGEITDMTAGQFTSDTQYFANLASAGITVFAASGDGGSTPDNMGGTTGPTQVEYPASDPNVTGVGGTTFQSSYYTGSQNFEYGWSLSGGGASGHFSRPSYQSGVTGMPSGSQRCVPDVSCAADLNYGAVVILNGAQAIIGGTSWSTPTWAGFCALINQARASANLSPIGAINSSLYPLRATTSFTDIMSGNNGYAAGVGYDLVTGIGVPNVQNLVPALARGWISSPETILHVFQDGSVANDGSQPSTPLVQGSDGNFYGTTSKGGAFYSGGAVYKITPQGAVTILHSFDDGSVVNDGSSPQSALIQGTDGNFYGTTSSGGSAGYGTIFKITPLGAVTIVHSFGDGSVTNDGLNPSANCALLQASDGNFYGATGGGGTYNAGTIFKITPQGAVTILHNFADGTVSDEGTSPGTLIQGTDGNFYGTANTGGGFNGGTIYKMTSQGTLTTLHNFGDSSLPNDGSNPVGALVQGLDGNFYGTTSSGGSASHGTIFQITPQGVLTTFHSFSDGSVANDGMSPQSGLVQTSNGNFYGATQGGGSASQGTIFQMTTAGGVTILHNFYDSSVSNDGYDPLAGVIHGADGNFYGTTSADGSGGNGTVFKLTTQISPTITSPSTATFTVGIAGSFTVTATGNPEPTLSVRNLPSWATFTASTGVLSGTPTTTSGQPYTIVFAANNQIGGLAAQTFELNVQALSQHTAPTITNSPLSANAVVDTAYSFTYQATGSPAPTFSLASGALPLGLSLSPAGVLSGIPLQSGTFAGIVKASNGVGTAATQSFSLTVQRVPAITSGSPPASVAINVPYSFTFAAAGPPAATFAVTQGSLPTGMTLTSTGVLSGTPTQSGQFNATVTASNGVGTDSLAFYISVNQEPSFTSGPPTAVTVLNQSYNFTIQANGFPPPNFSLTSGSLPPGISLFGGVLSGYPYNLGTFTGTITASNGIGTPATQNFSITVGQAPTFTNAPPTTPIALNGSFSFTFQDGGSPAPTFTVTSGSLPPGLTLTSAGVLSGTPTQAGIYTGVITITNVVGSTTQNFSITVDANTAPKITNGPPPATGSTGLAYGFTYSASGFPVPIFSVSAGSLPPGLTLSAAGVISGTPIQAGTYTGTVEATNSSGPAAMQAFSIVITRDSITYTILHNFEDGSVAHDGTNFLGGLVRGTDGNLYGVTEGGGSQFEGTVFKITPAGAETILHTFADGTVANDGQEPTGPLILGVDGNLYGTAQNGGLTNQGVVFKITPAGAETILYSFGSGSVTPDGVSPYGGLTIGTDGNFYGTTTGGGSTNKGIAFKVTPQGVETILHNFGDDSVVNDGSQPRGNLIQATDGNFYGTTPYGGSAGEGTIFKMTPAGVMTILHSFGDASITDDGSAPLSGLIQAPNGSLYGLTELGGISGSGTTFGTFFKISLSGTMTMLLRFGNDTTANDAIQPWDALILGPDGNFYGTSYYGGTTGYGSIFEATSQGSVSILHSFNSGAPANDGTNPTAGLVLGSNGNLYGGSNHGGSAGGGDIFQLSLSSSPAITSANSTTFTEGYAGNFTFTATGNPAPTFSATGLPPWASLNAMTGVLSGTPPTATGGPFTLTITATNGNSPNATQAFTLDVQPILTFSEWEASFPNPITSGPSATPENDGVPNLLKYLYDIDPSEPMTAADRAALPTVGMTTIKGTNYLTLTYREYQQLDPSVIVNVQSSSDLQTWTTLPQGQTATETTCTLQKVNTDPTTGDPIMQAAVLVTGTKQFVRLQVTQ